MKTKVALALAGLVLILFPLEQTWAAWARPAECSTLEQMNAKYANMQLDPDARWLKSMAVRWHAENCKGTQGMKRTKRVPLRR